MVTLQQNALRQSRQDILWRKLHANSAHAQEGPQRSRNDHTSSGGMGGSPWSGTLRDFRPDPGANYWWRGGTQQKPSETSSQHKRGRSHNAPHLTRKPRGSPQGSLGAGVYSSAPTYSSILFSEQAPTGFPVCLTKRRIAGPLGHRDAEQIPVHRCFAERRVRMSGLSKIEMRA